MLNCSGFLRPTTFTFLRACSKAVLLENFKVTTQATTVVASVSFLDFEWVIPGFEGNFTFLCLWHLLFLCSDHIMHGNRVSRKL